MERSTLYIMFVVGETVRTVNKRGLRYLYSVVLLPKTRPIEATGPREAGGRSYWMLSLVGRLRDQVVQATGLSLSSELRRI